MKKSKHTPKICAVLGAGNFGTAIAQVLAENGHRVHIWNWEGDQKPLKEIAKYNENKSYLPGVRLLKQVIPFFDIQEALSGVDFVFMAIPTHAMEHTISFAGRHIPSNAILTNLSKGFHNQLLVSNSQIISNHISSTVKKNIVTISGPAVANQLVRHNVTAMNIASKNKKALLAVKQVLSNPFLKLVPTNDVIGIEIAGSFKNVYSVLLGICDGMEISLNTKAALMTEALHEISTMIVAMGGKKDTAYQLAGVGDLIGTAFCETSRNRRFGHYLGQGLSADEARKKVKQTVEGEFAATCLTKLAKQHRVSLPLAELVYKSIHNKKSVSKLVHTYLANMYA